MLTVHPEPVPAVQGSGRGGVLSSPNFRALYGSQLASSLGGAISSVSVSWLVYHVTGSSLAVAYVGLSGIVPGILLGLFAGVIADRYDRRRLMITCDLARLVAMATLAVFLWRFGFSLFLILAVMLVVFSFSALFTPASQALLPRLVHNTELEQANGVLTASNQFAYLIGAAGGGIVVAVAGAVIGLAVNALTFGLSAVLLLQIAASLGPPVRTGSGPPPSFGAQLSEGLRYMRDHRPILEVSVGFMPATFLFTLIAAFLVVYAANRFGADPASYGYLLAALAAGGVVGALTIGRFRPRRVAGTLLCLGVLALGGSAALLSVSPGLLTSLLGAVGLGLGIGVINTVYYATIQAVVPNDILARVLSIDSVSSFASIPGGLLVGGVLISLFGITATYGIAAVGLTINGVAMLALPDVRRFGQPV